MTGAEPRSRRGVGSAMSDRPPLDPERDRLSGRVRRFVCTVKFQGETDHDTARALAAIPGGRLVHLFHNRHELTFIRFQGA